MSSLGIVVVLLVVSLFLMQVNLGLAQSNKSLSVTLQKAPVRVQQKPGALSVPVPIPLITPLTAQLILAVPRQGRVVTPLTVVIDTSKTDFWIIDSACRSSYCVNRAQTTSLYDRLATLTFYDLRQSINLKYMDNMYQVTGIRGLEQITLAGAVIHNQELIRVSSTTGFSVGNSFDGFMGLGNSLPTNTILNRASVLDRLLDQGLIDRRTFTISTLGTLLTFGDIPTFPTPINYMPVANRGNWDFRVSSVSVDNGAGVAISVVRNVVFRIESILSNIGIPSAQLNILARGLGANLNPTTKKYEVICASIFGGDNLIVLAINGVTYEIPSAFLASQPVPPSTVCTLNVFETKKDWIMGQLFLSAFSVVFDADNNRIGLVEPLIPETK